MVGFFIGDHPEQQVIAQCKEKGRYPCRVCITPFNELYNPNLNINTKLRTEKMFDKIWNNPKCEDDLGFQTDNSARLRLDTFGSDEGGIFSSTPYSLFHAITGIIKKTLTDFNVAIFYGGLPPIDSELISAEELLKGLENSQSKVSIPGKARERFETFDRYWKNVPHFGIRSKHTGFLFTIDFNFIYRSSHLSTQI